MHTLLTQSQVQHIISGMSNSPKLQASSVRQIYNDGRHNAFTDLCRFGTNLYLTFRSCPHGHSLSSTSQIVILTSVDGGQWNEVHRFGVAGRDVRDPHFLVFRDALFVYTGTWLVPSDQGASSLNEHLGYCVCSNDGRSWAAPCMLEGTYGHYIWRAAAHAGKAYLCARRRVQFGSGYAHESSPESIQSALLESDDGFVWKFAGLFTEDHGDETAFLFESDGAILALARGGGPQPARICRAKPPYREWQRVELDRNVGGPLIGRWADRILVAGRKILQPNPPCTAVYFLDDDTLQEALVLPSGGDTSYPGFVALNARRGLFSYYSSHEGSGTSLAPSAIYLAELELGAEQ